MKQYGARGLRDRMTPYKALVEMNERFPVPIDPERLALFPIEPIQWREMHGPCPLPRGEGALWETVFREGLADYLTPPRDFRRDRGGNRGEEARGWVEHSGKYPGSFSWCCDIFGIERQPARTALRLMRLRMLARHVAPQVRALAKEAE